MLCDVEVQDAPAIMGDDEETVEHTESDRRDTRWLRRKASQRLAGSGSLGARLIHRETVLSETSKPSMRSSPWMRGAPHVGFSATIWKISSRTSFDVCLLPMGFLDLGQRVQEDINNFWMGHATETMSETYSRLDLELDLRLAEAESMGVGFTGPPITIAPSCSKFSDESAVELVLQL